MNDIRALVTEYRAMLERYQEELLAYNRQINLISRRPDPDFFDHHIVHVCAFCLKNFCPGSVIVDWGTGGGLPAIPLAIINGDVSVAAVDSTGKKVRAVSQIARTLELSNLSTWNGRAENWEGTCDYSVSRATASISRLWQWHRKARSKRTMSVLKSDWRPGLLCLKGGKLDRELADLHTVDPLVEVEKWSIEEILEDTFFAEKYLLHVTSTVRSDDTAVRSSKTADTVDPADT